MEVVVECFVVVIKVFNDVLRWFVEEGLMVEVRGEWLVYFMNFRDKLKFEDVRVEYVGKLVEIKGLVIGVSNVWLFYRKVVFVCLDCGVRMVRL